jgi:hypothetical protein
MLSFSIAVTTRFPGRTMNKGECLHCVSIKAGINHNVDGPSISSKGKSYSNSDKNVI